MAEGVCRYCGNKYKNPNVHERFCKSNPDHNSQQQGIIKQEGVMKEIPNEPKKIPLKIRNIQEIGIGEVNLKAFFKTPDGTMTTVPSFIGIIVNGEEETPTTLIITAQGLLLPPFMIEGFIGMFPDTNAPEENPIEKTPQQTKEPLSSNASSKDMFQRILDEKKVVDGK